MEGETLSQTEVDEGDVSMVKEAVVWRNGTETSAKTQQSKKKETKKKIQNLKVCINSKRVDLYDDCSGRKKIAFGCFICRQTGSNAFVPR